MASCSMQVVIGNACRLEEAKQVAALQASAFYEPLALLGPLNKILQLGFEVRIYSAILFAVPDLVLHDSCGQIV